jgi:hypothetical protein
MIVVPFGTLIDVGPKIDTATAPSFSKVAAVLPLPST